MGINPPCRLIEGRAGLVSSDKSRTERRDTSPAGIWNRAQFEMSLGMMRLAGFSEDAIEYFRRRARETGQLPHQLLVEIVEDSLRGITAMRDRGDGGC
jgi:hypothetical protein